jgi:two-component system, sensor histidine kinase and response regulator
VSSERILVLDDDDATRKAMLHVLGAEGYGALEGTSAQHALTLLGEQAFDLVIIDMMLSGRSGVEVCERMRSSERHRDVPVLFVSASGDGQTHRAAIEAGGDDFLTKPLHRGELLLRVRSLLQFRRMQTELAQSNALLIEQRDRLLKLQRQKDELTEIIVHDLKNPLAAIASNASYLTSADDLQEDTRDCASAIARAADNMLRMVHNLLDISRAEDAGLVLRKERTDVAKLLVRTAALMERRARDKKVTILREGPAEGVWCECDPDIVRRMLENLVDNALRYTPSRSQVTLEVCHPEAGEIAVSVRDQGPGVPEAERARVFEKYAQLDRPADRAQQRFGRGIGLTFVKMAADAHGGRIWVDEAPPRGAAFQLRLPVGNPRPSGRPAS